MARNNRKMTYYHTVKARVDGELYEKICNGADAANLSVSEYIRQMIKKGRVTVKQEIIADVLQIRKIQAELGKIGSNLNQIARHFNSGGPYDAEIQWMLNRCTAALGDIKFEAESMAGDFRGYSQACLRKKQ